MLYGFWMINSVYNWFCIAFLSKFLLGKRVFEPGFAQEFFKLFNPVFQAMKSNEDVKNSAKQRAKVQMIREAKVMHKLDHENIVKVRFFAFDLLL